MSTIVTERPNAALVRRVYEAFNTGDLDALTGLLSPDVSFLQPGRSTVSGLYEGRDAVFGWFGALAAATGGTFRAELLDLYPNDTQVVAVNKSYGHAGRRGALRGRRTRVRGFRRRGHRGHRAREASGGMGRVLHLARSSNIRDLRQATPLKGTRHVSSRCGHHPHRLRGVRPP